MAELSPQCWTLVEWQWSLEDRCNVEFFVSVCPYENDEFAMIKY